MRLYSAFVTVLHLAHPFPSTICGDALLLLGCSNYFVQIHCYVLHKSPNRLMALCLLSDRFEQFGMGFSGWFELVQLVESRKRN